MGKILAILAASAAVAGGGTYAFFHYANPYGGCPLSGCETAKVKCCAEPTADACATGEACPASAATTDSTVAAAGPVGMFVTTPVAADDGCCPLCAVKRTSPTAVAAVVGPAAAVR